MILRPNAPSDDVGPKLLFEHAPLPAQARRRFERLVEAGLDADSLTDTSREIVWIACVRAPYLATLATRDIRRLVRAAQDPYLFREKPAALMAQELEAELVGTRGTVDLSRRLRGFRAREFVRLGARECGTGARQEVGRELAHLADVSLEAAIRFHDRDLSQDFGPPRTEDGEPARFAVMGMGKLGGEELNFTSDIDLIYLYSSDQGTAGPLSLHEYFDRLARRVTRTMGEVTEDDTVFRVDLRLRPEGSRGPLVNSLAAAERYYESFGRAWERQAWLKARPSAGDLALGAEALAMLEPFVYPRHTSPQTIREVEELNRRIKSELDTTSLGGSYDVKTGAGGIREIEFFVQALQLVHAGKNRALRERSTRRALDRLFFAGLVAERERRALADAYDFLRQVEHMLQLDAGLQTHRLPADHEGLELLAGRMGFADAGEMASRLKLHTQEVAELFATLSTGGEPPIPPEVAVLIGSGPDTPLASQRALEILGFRDPEAAAFQLELLRRKPLSPIGPAATESGARVAPALLRAISASPDPDQALRFFVDFASRRGAWPGQWTLFDENRPLLRLLASLFGTSAFLARIFVSHPELTDTLLAPGRHRLDPELLDGDDTPEARWNALRRLKNEETLRIGLADIAGDLDVYAVGEELTHLADVCLDRTFALVRTALERRIGRLAPMAVVGLGKLGGRELGYASDLDLVFVYDGGLDDHEPMSKLAQRLVGALGAYLEEGRLYEVDTRLRPSGQKGTLVSSLIAFRAYHEKTAQLWERQALIKARFVAGDPLLGARVEALAQHFIYGQSGPHRHAVAEAISAMRGRMETELSRECIGPFDLKVGRGGLADIEFAAQYLQLVHGPAHPELRVRETVCALERARALGLLDPERYRAFVDGYRFLRHLEHRMRIVHDRPIHELPQDPTELDKLARRSGFSSGAALERAYLNWTRDVRSAYAKLLGL